MSESPKSDYRVLHGVRVRVHPEPHPRPFNCELTRWQVIADNIEVAQRCLNGGDRSLYFALADARARALQRLAFERRIAERLGLDGEGRSLPF